MKMICCVSNSRVPFVDFFFQLNVHYVILIYILNFIHIITLLRQM